MNIQMDVDIVVRTLREEHRVEDVEMMDVSEIQIDGHGSELQTRVSPEQVS